MDQLSVIDTQHRMERTARRGRVALCWTHCPQERGLLSLGTAVKTRQLFCSPALSWVVFYDWQLGMNGKLPPNHPRPPALRKILATARYRPSYTGHTLVCWLVDRSDGFATGINLPLPLSVFSTRAHNELRCLEYLAIICGWLATYEFWLSLSSSSNHGIRSRSVALAASYSTHNGTDREELSPAAHCMLCPPCLFLSAHSGCQSLKQLSCSFASASRISSRLIVETVLHYSLRLTSEKSNRFLAMIQCCLVGSGTQPSVATAFALPDDGPKAETRRTSVAQSSFQSVPSYRTVQQYCR